MADPRDKPNVAADKADRKIFSSGQLARRSSTTRNAFAVRASLPVYRQMRRDPNIALALALIKAPIYSLQWHIESDQEDVQADLTAIVARLWRSIVRTSLTAVEYGFAPHEKIWALEPDGRPTLAKLNDLEPWLTTVMADKATGAFAGFKYRPGGALSSAAEVFIPAEKAFVFTHAKEYGSLYGGSRLDAAYKPWDRGEKARDNFGDYLDRKANPPIKGRAPAETRQDANGTEIDCIEEAEKNLLALAKGGVATFPSEYDEAGKPVWDAEYMQVPQRAEEFIKGFGYFDTRCFRATLVPEAVATHGNVGAFAAIKQYTETFMTLEDMLAEDFVEQADKYIVQKLVALRHQGAEAHLRAGALSQQVNERYVQLIETLLASPMTAALVIRALDMAAIVQGSGLPAQPLEDQGQGGAAAASPSGEPQPGAALALRAVGADPRESALAEAMDDVADYYEWLLARAKKKSLRRKLRLTLGSPTPLEATTP